MVKTCLPSVMVPGGGQKLEECSPASPWSRSGGQRPGLAEPQGFGVFHGTPEPWAEPGTAVAGVAGGTRPRAGLAAANAAASPAPSIRDSF